MEWHYAIDGHRKGPVSETEISELIKTGAINRDTSVWNASLPDWQPLSASALSLEISGPPPLTGAAVNNSIVWALAFCPLYGSFIEGFAAANFKESYHVGAATVILNVVLGLIDEQYLKKAGHDTKAMGGAWLVPIYLYKRAKILRQNNAYFWVWCVLFVLSLLFI